MVMEKIEEKARGIIEELKNFLNDREDLDSVIDSIEDYAYEIIRLINKLR